MLKKFFLGFLVILLLSSDTLQTKGITSIVFNDGIGIDFTSTVVNGGSGRVVSLLLTKSAVGLSRANNTNDLEKPLSNATTVALTEKQNSINTLNTRVNDLNTKVSNLSTGTTGTVDLTTVNNNILALQNDVSIIKNDILSMKGNIASLQLDLNATKIAATKVDTIWFKGFAGKGTKLTPYYDSTRTTLSAGRNPFSLGNPSYGSSHKDTVILKQKIKNKYLINKNK